MRTQFDGELGASLNLEAAALRCCSQLTISSLPPTLQLSASLHVLSYPCDIRLRLPHGSPRPGACASSSCAQREAQEAKRAEAARVRRKATKKAEQVLAPLEAPPELPPPPPPSHGGAGWSSTSGQGSGPNSPERFSPGGHGGSPFGNGSFRGGFRAGSASSPLSAIGEKLAALSRLGK